VSLLESGVVLGEKARSFQTAPPPARMPTRNEQIIQRGFDAFETADMDAFTADWAPDVVWDLTHHDTWPGDADRYVGAGAILAAFGRFLAGAQTLRLEMHELRELPDGRVIALYTEWRREPGETEPKPIEMGIVYTLEGGQVKLMQVHTGFDSARRTAAAE
jgi:ketosteroid isomerase-like protein